eukprot:Gb_32735 [translate_table: standard]
MGYEELSAQGMVVAVILVVLVSILSIKFGLGGHRNGKYRLPPGPTPLPIIGNLHKLGKLPHRSLQALAKKYGPLMYLRLGSVPTVVASSPEMAKEFLKTHDANFSSRPITSAGKYTAYDFKGITLAPYGSNWRDVRKICNIELLTAKRLQSFQSLREEEVGLMVDSIAKESAYPVNLSKTLASLTTNIMCRIVIGRKYSEGDLACGEFHEMVHDLFSTNGAFNIGDFIPWLQRFDLQGIVRRTKNAHKIFDVFAENVIDEHVVENMELKEGGKDFVDVLLDMKMCRESIKALIFDMLLGGLETSSTTLEWTLSELLRNPHVMKKAQQELESVVGKNRRVKESDLSHLKYLRCVVKETLRLHPAGPLMVPHESMEDCTVGEYHIPAKTRLIVNVWAIGRDPSEWEDPLAFRPERFIERDIDVTGQNFAIIPFGSGRRGCPGSSLGLVIVELAVAQLLHCFEWSLNDEYDPADLNMSESFQLSIPRQHPLYALPTFRLPGCL